MKNVKSCIAGVSLFYLTAYVPLSFMVYCPLWYKFNCLFHPGCEFIGERQTSWLVGELIGFFLHRWELTYEWTAKERIHLLEVRNILDILAILVCIAVISFFITCDKSKLLNLARSNIIISSSLLLLVPFFKAFWLDIFHPLLFNNDYWMNTQEDVSFYIMPWEFFKYSIILFIVALIIINAIIWFVFREKEKGILTV